MEQIIAPFHYATVAVGSKTVKKKQQFHYTTVAFVDAIVWTQECIQRCIDHAGYLGMALAGSRTNSSNYAEVAADKGDLMLHETVLNCRMVSLASLFIVAVAVAVLSDIGWKMRNRFNFCL